MSVFLPSTERNLILTGYIGPNTALLGQQIAERLRMPFVNIEQQIADRVGLNTDEIRSYYGERRLKSIEMEIIQEAILRRSTVIRISGRTLLHADHLTQLKNTGPVLCLVISLDAMLQKMHVIMGASYHNPNERALFLGELKQEWSIRKAEGIHEISTTYLETNEIIETVISQWQDLTLERV